MKSVVILFFFTCVIFQSQAETVGLPPGIIETPRHIAPAIKLADMDGQVQELSHLHGQWVFVHF